MMSDQSVRPTEPHDQRGGATQRKRRRRAFGTRKSSILTIIMWTCAAYILVPLAWLVISTSKDDGGLYSTFGLLPGSLDQVFTNIQLVFSTNDGEFAVWIRNTAVYAIVSAFGAVGLAALAGYALAKYRFVGDRAVLAIILGAVMIPGTALALPLYFLFVEAGLTNTMWAVILPSIVSPFGVYLMKIYSAEAIDDSLLEAARIDGAGEFRIFWTVSLKLLAPALVTVFLIELVQTWNSFLLPLIMLNDSSLFPITVGLSQWRDSTDNASLDRIANTTLITGAFVATIPLVVAFLTLQRYWQSGLSSGSVKG